MAIRAGTTFLLLPRKERPRGYVDKLLKALAQHKTREASVDAESSNSAAKKLSSVITLWIVTLQNAAAQSCFVCVTARTMRMIHGQLLVCAWHVVSPIFSLVGKMMPVAGIKH